MADKKKLYQPPHRRRSSSVVRRDFRRRLRGKPTHSSLLSLPRFFSRVISRVALIALILLLTGGFLAGGTGLGMLIGYIVTAEPVVTEQIKNMNETTRITDAQGKDIAILTGSQNINREFISISQVKNTYIIDAFKAIEDERYDEHIGIDPRRIGSAILSALANNGSPTHGGSTITQQTVKLISGADQVSAQRKVQEWYKAIQLEQQKSKDEVMELYINLVPMGNSYVGIQSAAKAYFDKEASQLNLVECAFLAGIPNRPSTYNPLTETGKRNALRRMRIVLSKMYELEMITRSEYETALDTELVFRKTPMSVSATQINSYFVDYVIETVINDLVERRGYSTDMARLAVYNYGLRIETTLDQEIQEKIETTFNNQELFASNPDILMDLPEKPNGSITIVENSPNQGQIKAMVGGFGEKTGNFVLNRAVDTKRQPGSSIKPLAVYGPALDTGRITAASIFTDMEMFLNSDEPDEPYPRNSYTGYRGNMSVRDALRISANTIAAHIWLNVLGDGKGSDTSLQYLRQVGLDRSRENYVSISLGAFNQGMSSLEMASAYSVFANEGLYTPPYAYTRVLDADGNVLLENRPVFTQVYKPETAWVMTSILKEVLTGGTAAGYTLPDNEIEVAGKTGTTDKNRDKWFCGYSPYYTAAVWYGYDNRLGMTTIPRGDFSNAIRIWHDAMTKIHEGLEPAGFDRLETVETIRVCPDSGMREGPYCPGSKIEYFIPGSIMNPQEECTLHKPEPTPEPTPEPESEDDEHPHGGPPGQNEDDN